VTRANQISRIGAPKRQPMFEHVRELRKRLFWSVAIIGAAGAVGYSFHEQLLFVLQRPLGQTLYFTSPTGGFSFVFKACFFFGVLVALPVIIYHICRFLGPVVTSATRRLFVGVVFWSLILAAAGVTFAYFISLPAALNFLTSFGGPNIQSLITADEYFNFAITYLVGFALMFQLPLLVLFINRIKPLKPGSMMKTQRYVVIFSFVAAAILTPTPDPFNQLLMAAPAILLYQVAIVMVLSINYKNSTRRRRIERKAEAASKAFHAKNATLRPTVATTRQLQLQPAPTIAQRAPAIAPRFQPMPQAAIREVHQPRQRFMPAMASAANMGSQLHARQKAFDVF